MYASNKLLLSEALERLGAGWLGRCVGGGVYNMRKLHAAVRERITVSMGHLPTTTAAGATALHITATVIH